MSKTENYIPQTGDKLSKYYFNVDVMDYKKTTLVVKKVTPLIDNGYEVVYDEDTDNGIVEHKCKFHDSLDGYVSRSNAGLHVFLKNGTKRKAKKLVSEVLKRYLEEAEYNFTIAECRYDNLKHM